MAPGATTRVFKPCDAPMGEVEENLAQIWRELFNIELINRNDDFFALGGHSLLAVRLLARIRQTGLDTTVRDVFDAPTLAMLASTLTPYNAVTMPRNLITEDSTDITPEMLPLITLSQADIDSIVAQIPGGVANIQDIYGLTPMQSSLLHHHRMAKEGDSYMHVSQLRFDDRSSLERYANAMQHMIERHDILRTAIFWDGLSEPAQVVLRQVPSILIKIEVDGSDKPALDQLNQKFLQQYHQFDLNQAPLLRLLAAPEWEGKWVAVQLMHHAIIDHSTRERLNAEMHVIMGGKIETLKTLTPFRSFVAETRQGISSAEYTRFFTEMLGDIDEPTLPFGLSDIHRDRSEINEAHFELPQTLNDQLRAHARNLKVSLASICHLAWAQVVAKASGRESVVFGTVLLGRLQAGEGNNNIVGPMINILPMRLDIDDRSVEITARDTHARLSALLAYEHAPLTLAERCSGVMVGLPLFSALLNYRQKQKTEEANTILPGVNFLDHVEQTNYPLTLDVDDNDSSLCLSVRVVSSMSAERICAYVQQTLESLANALTQTPQQPVQKLRVMPPDERLLLLNEWNPTTLTEPPSCCLHQLFEAQVECTGQAIAVEYQGQTLSYSELNIQANRLAHYIIAQGVKPDDRIALCVGRSTAMIAAILGILKAGCAYVPLDPAYPSQRLTNILLDTDPRFLIADETGRNVLGEHQIPVINLEMSLPSDLPIDNPDTTQIGLTPDHLAYIIYTSGSTGTPKGVMVEHGQVVRHMKGTNNQFDFNKQDKWCLFHSISYDMSLSVIWGALLYGGQLFILPNHIAHSADDFYDWICSKGITVIIQTPTLSKVLMRARNFNSRADHLRYVMFGGEAIDPKILKDWYDKYDNGKTIVVSRYGSTETVMLVRVCFCDSTFAGRSAIPLGGPLLNKSIYLLDSQMEPVLLGAEGEIYVGGVGMARGYFRRPDLTAERFLPDPFSEMTAARMYRTGDRARYLPDGNLVFLGRTDQQVKIRGFRIELGEIEARLIEHPQVSEAVVQPYGKGSDELLVAYVVADENEYLVQNLRAYLMDLLPDFMVPSAYVRLPALPLTANGKLHRRALLAPDDQAFARQHYEAPRGEMEEKLAQIWRELLSIDRVGRYDNFFALGGHSLLIVRLLEQLRQLGLDTTVKDVFSAPSLATLASKLTRYKAVPIPRNLITKDSTEITPEMLPLITLSQADIDSIVAQIPGGVANIQDIYGLTPLQDGMLYHHLMAKEGDPYILASQLRFDDRTSLERYANAMQHVIERHDILRTAIFWDGLSEPAQVVLRQVPSLLTEIKFAECDKSPLEQLSQEFHPRSYRLDLAKAPLMRLIAAQESDGSLVAVQLIHHLIDDYSSVQILYGEVCAIMNGTTEMLTTPIPFRNFVAQVRLEASLAEHSQFFTQMLGDIDEPTLPFGLSDVHQDGSEFNQAHLMLPQTLNDQLRAHARNFQVSLGSICHLAWAQVVAKASGRESVVFGTVLLGRLQAGEGNNNIVGPMINTLPLRINIDETSVENAVLFTHSRLSALLAHEHAPLTLAQRCSSVMVGLPLFSALLNYRQKQKTEETNMLLPGVSFLENVEQTNYPLTISLDDDDNENSLSLSIEVVSPMSAARICAYMQQTLESLVDALTHAPQQPVQKLRVMPQEERTLLLHDWNQVPVAESPACCLHQLFEAQVENDGQAIAVEFQGQTLSYSELNIQANRLAHYLIAQGVKPDDRIALCVERSMKLVVAILGILKAGCAYVPLDPTYSSQRLNTILLDAQPTFLLADAIGRRTLGKHQVPVIELEKPLPVDLPIDNPDRSKLGLTAAHLAYVIYTSGSTGTPKGVMIEHRQVVRLFEVTRHEFDFNKQDKWCLFHSFSFDVSVWETWNAFFYGSTLLIAPYEITRSPDEFYDWICTNGVTVLNQTPSAFKFLMRIKDVNSRSDQLRYIIFAGEELDPSTVKDWHENRGTQLVNMYGPTETIHATLYKLKASENISTIGRPLADLCVYLLDSHGEPVPLGAVGEIYIGGASVARSYLNRPDLSAERFLLDPFSKKAAARMYRTGDLARYLPDGNLIFLGRIDQQVKIRGFRIELGEIENQLNSHSQIEESVVLARSDSKGNKRLIAYIVSAPNAPVVEMLEIHQYLQSRLPDYMIPAAFVSIDKLPMTQNSKLDRKALPEPSESAFLHQPYEEPVSQLEIVIAGIWQTLLEVDKVGRHDHFFELGGHSLLAISAVNLINRAVDGSKIRVSDIFAAPTVMNLAQRIKSQNRSSELVDLQKTALLPMDIQPVPVHEEPGKDILLTGATGFVGRYLLRELLDVSQSKIYCLVRGQNEADSLQRLMNIMSKWCLWREGDEQRLIVLNGDIKKERLDLNEQTYNQLSKDVGIIFHLAVSMNHLESFDMAHQANIMGVIELLRFATHGTNKLMNFASTTGVFSTVDQTGHRIVDESSIIRNERHLTDQGYESSKWVAEEIVNLAIDRGIACNIFRLGLITADSEHARHDELQAFYRLFKSSIQMGMAFVDHKTEILLTPVDFTAKALVHLGLTHNFSEYIFHFSTMDSISRCDFIEQLNEHLPRPLEVVSHRQWLQEARRRFLQGEILPITPLIQDLMMSSDEELNIYYETVKAATICIDSTKTLKKLAQADITIPAANHKWYRLFVDSLTTDSSIRCL